MTVSNATDARLLKGEHPLEKPNSLGNLPNYAVIAILIAGLFYVAWSLTQDLTSAVAVPWILLGLALVTALGFEFVNGFHDTANAVATVIYTNSMPAEIAVIWSGFFNFLGVMTASGAVAFGIISLLPVELIMQVGSSAGLAMVFSLLAAAIIWNLGTWYLGLPASSSHTLIGSIVGVGLANQFVAPTGTATSGVDWSKATEVGMSLLISPLVGFGAAALLLLAMKLFIKNKALYEASPKRQYPAAIVDPGAADLHLHGCKLCPWLERRPKGHGSHYAHLDWRRAYRLCTQPHTGRQLS